MKKVLLGVGIGCGVLVLLGIIGVGVAGYWAKQKLGGVMEASQKVQAQQQELAELESSYPFTPPDEGEVLELQEARLSDYLAIRESALPIYQDFEHKSDEINKEHEQGKGPGDIGAAMKAGSMLMTLMTDMRAAYISGLKQHRMSPSEFQSITHAIYNTYTGAAMQELKKATAAQREPLEQMLSEVQTKLDGANLSEEERTALEEQESELQDQLAALDEAAEEQPGTPAHGATLDANRALLEKFKERIEKGFNPAFDSFVADGNLAPSAETPCAPGTRALPWALAFPRRPRDGALECRISPLPTGSSSRCCSARSLSRPRSP